MRNGVSTSMPALLMLLMLSPAVLAQTGSVYAPGWLPCPRCQTAQERTAARKAVEARTFNPRDISGDSARNPWPPLAQLHQTESGSALS